MRVAIIGSKGIPAKSGGVERHVEELCVRLVKRGARVTVYSRPWYTGPVEPIHRGVRVVPIGSWRTKHFDTITHTFLATLEAVREGHDVYHYHGVGPSLLAFLPKLLRPGSKVVTTFHSIDRKHQKWGVLARLALKLGEWASCRFADATITVSKTLTHYAREVYNTEVTYIPNGITPPKAGTKSAVLKELGLAKGNYVVMLSRLVRHKGAHTLIDAWVHLKDSTEDERVQKLKLVIIGDGAFTDDYVREIHQLAQGHDDIVFAGFRTGSDLHALMTHAAFAVHPSVSEGLPIAVLEEMAYGQAVLAADTPEHLEIIEGRGYTFRVSDPRDLMLQLHYLATHTRERDAIGAKAKEFVTTYYKWDDVAKETLRLYRRVLEQKEPIRNKATERMAANVSRAEAEA
jgi:glycosyltransferase involved in cell wall biosynthesis